MLLFFGITGCIIPNYEDVQYYFLLDTCGLSVKQYGYLNMTQSVGLVVGIAFFIVKLKNVEVWKLILVSLITL